ncbi:MAG: LysR family transcriptional regulator, partial [Pseudomonas sp.]
MVELADMQLFVRAVAAGSLSAAGRELNLSPAVASKRMSRLEQRLGVRLLQRSSRRLVLTAEGADYWQRVSAILADLDEAHA